MIWLACAVVLLAVLLPMVFLVAVGFVMGGISYHLSRQAVLQYQPMRKAFDPQADKMKELAVARKLTKEITDLQTAHLGGLQLTREQYLAAEGGK